MPLSGKKGQLSWNKLDSRSQLYMWFIWFGVLILFSLSWYFVSEHTIWEYFFDGPRQFGVMLSRMFPPKFDYAPGLVKPLWDTLVIASLGTIIAIIPAVPLAFLAARNTTPHRFLVRPFALYLIVASRSINSLIWALILVIVFGPGILAGILAIALRSVGFVAKLLYEAIEEIDDKQVEAVKSTGASPLQYVQIGIVPQVMPAFVSTSVYRWDINIRESTTVGLVGAGGIGLQLSASINTLAWNQVAVIVLIILVSVLISEWITRKIRKAII